MNELFDLWDYRRRVSELYTAVRAGGAGAATWEIWRTERDRLFATHPQTPIEEPSQFTGLDYFPYDPEWRVDAVFTPTEAPREMGHSAEGYTRFTTFGRLNFSLKGTEVSLTLLWLEAYGGGVFLPFRDLTNGETTYGGGRYLLDTVKGADLGGVADGVILDFNYSYHPSCVHSSRWSCPLAPPENGIELAVEAGERLKV